MFVQRAVAVIFAPLRLTLLLKVQLPPRDGSQQIKELLLKAPAAPLAYKEPLCAAGTALYF